MLAALLSTLLVAAGPNDELRAMEGVWAVDRMEQQGRKFPTDLVLKVQLQIRGDQFLFVNGKDNEFTTTVTKFDPTADPKAIDLTRAGDRQTVKGIYKFEGDTLTICTNARGARPTAFATDPQSPNVLTVYKRPTAGR